MSTNVIEAPVSVGQHVYIVYCEEIYEETVMMIGEECFAHKNTFDYGLVEDYRQPVEYSDENKTWFKTLDDAKEALLKKYASEPDIKHEIEKVQDDVWRIV